MTDGLHVDAARDIQPSQATTAQRTRVLIFTNSVTMGGMEEHVALLARHLDRRLFEVFAVCPKWQPAERLQVMLANSADHLAVSTPDRRWGLLSMIGETIRLHRQLRDWKIDVVHMHSTTYRGQVFALIGCWASGVRRVYVTEHLAPDAALPGPERWLRNVFSAAVTGIVCVSQKNLEARRAYIYTPRDRTVVVENGIDVAKFQPIPADDLAKLRAAYSIPSDAPIVGTAVRFEPDKGLADLIAAMPAIHAAIPDVHFLLVGDGSLRKDLEGQVARLNLTDRVRFTGFQTDPRPFLGLMDVFVLPVPVGSMSIGLLEAMAMERTVVMTFGGDGEAVIDGESGFCATPRDPASIARLTIQALQDPELRRQVGRAARQRVTDHFSAQRVAASLGALYRQQET